MLHLTCKDSRLVANWRHELVRLGFPFQRITDERSRKRGKAHITMAPLPDVYRVAATASIQNPVQQPAPDGRLVRLREPWTAKPATLRYQPAYFRVVS